MRDARVVTAKGRPKHRPLAIVVRSDGLLVGASGLRKLSAIEPCGCLHEEGFHEQAGFISALGEGKPVVGEIGRRADFAADEPPFPQSQHDAEGPFDIPQPLGEIAGPLQDRPDFRRRVSADRNIRRTESGKVLQLQVVTLGRFAERAEQVEPFGEVADRLDVGGTVPRTLPGLQPVRDGLLACPASLKWWASNSGRCSTVCGKRVSNA